jgi:hypothetical protein
LDLDVIRTWGALLTKWVKMPAGCKGPISMHLCLRRRPTGYLELLGKQQKYEIPLIILR